MEVDKNSHELSPYEPKAWLNLEISSPLIELDFYWGAGTKKKKLNSWTTDAPRATFSVEQNTLPFTFNDLLQRVKEKDPVRIFVILKVAALTRVTRFEFFGMVHGSAGILST